MKSLAITLLFLGVNLLAQAADPVKLDGQWKVHMSIVGNDSDQTCTFVQKDTDLTGSCAGDSGTKDISGKVTDNKIEWQMKTEYNGGPLTLNYKGTFDAENKKISGTVSVVEYQVDGDFSGTPLK